MKLHLTAALALAPICAGSVLAQGYNPSIEIAPNPTVQNGNITITVTAPRESAIEYYPGLGQFATWPALCLPYDHINSTNTSLFWCGSALMYSPTKYTLGARQVTRQTFHFCAPPGDYAMKLPYFLPGNSQQLEEWACFRVAGNNDPTLSASGIAKVGQPLIMNLAAPALPGQPYILAPSFTSNFGLQLNALDMLCLDADPMFFLFLSGAGGPLFVNFAGLLDNSGNAPQITFFVPAIPELAWLPLKVQGLAGNIYSIYGISNQLNFCIQP